MQNLNPVSPCGTLSRKAFFITMVCIVLTASLTGYALEALGFIEEEGPEPVWWNALALSFMIPGFFAVIKRCRDCALKPVWTLLYFVPLAGFLFVAFLCLFRRRG